jgi:hypothetical protein
MLDYNQIKVKYLDKEDVKSLYNKELVVDDEYAQGGWTQKYLDSLEWYVEINSPNSSIPGLIFISKSKDGVISIEVDETFIFQGNIKNKSELKVLLKQLGVYVE